MQTLSSGIESAHIRVFSLKIEQIYTLTMKSKSTYDSLVWLGFFDLSKLLKKKIDRTADHLVF